MNWIPVTERLPGVTPGFGTSATVLVFNSEGVTAATFDGEEWRARCWNSCGCCYDFDKNVTHWMPLPEPPKGHK